MVKFGLSVIWVVINLVVSVQAVNTPFVTGPDQSRSQLGVLENPALADEASAVWINPAGLGVRQSGTSFVSAGFENNPSYANIMFAGGGSGFAWQRTDIGGGQRVDRWRFAGGGNSPHGASFGVAAELSDPDGMGENLFWSADVGFLARPVSFISAGVVARRLGAPSGHPWSLETGLALRPLGTAFTVFGGVVYYENDKRNAPSHWHVGGMANIGPGVELYTAFNQKRTVLAGMQMSLGKATIGGSANRPTGNNLGSGWIAVRTHADYRSNRLAMKGRIAEIRLEGEIRDQAPAFAFFGERGTTLANVITQINRAGQARDVGGLYLRMDNLSIGQGMAEELRDALVRFKERTGKPIVVYMPEASFREYFIASVADSVFLEPMGDLRLTGFGVGQMYFRRALDKLGVEPDFTRIGKYKSAAETFTDSVMSSPTREQYSELLDDWYERTVRAIATSRGVSVDSVRALVNRAPYTARDAVAYGLVDSVGHEDRAFESAKTMVKAREGRVSGKINLAQRRLYSEAWGPHPQVAVVFATGEIVTGRGGGDFLSGSQAMGAETMAKALRQVRKNNRVKAVVLRVDSPGGSALASDIIWREMQLLWETDKPVVISVGDLAASGGYYIACRGDSIVANAGSIVGSIGVFDGKFVVQRLANRLGVDYELLARGDNALINSALARRTPEQQQRVADNVRQVYDVFVDRVAQGRGMTASRVDSLGQGRIYTAANAVNIGLVDRLGGLEDAVEIAMRMAGISGEVEILPYPRRSHILETVMRNSVEENAAWGLRWEDANGVLFYDATAASMR